MSILNKIGSWMDGDKDYQALPCTTVNKPDGSPYLSIIDADPMIKIQMHKYDKEYPRGLFFTFDKKALSDVIKALEKYEDY